MKKIFVLAPYFWPAKKAGGPVKSMGAIVELLSTNAEVKVLTQAYDVGSKTVMGDVVPDSWIRLPQCSVYYSSGSLKVLMQIVAAGRVKDTDVVFYLNSFFAFTLSILFFILKRFGFVKASSKVILAPRGEFSEGALMLKPLKKRVFISLSKLARLHDGITWHATSDEESKDIARVFGDGVTVRVAPNIVDMRIRQKVFETKKEGGRLKLIFLSRISPKKNLEYALKILMSVRAEVAFDIYGPKEDNDYWICCEELIKKLPSNVVVRYMGPVDVDEVPDVIARYHLFILPTLGENFCHAIAEALQCGCPVLVSDQTPWRGLAEQGVGWDIPLANSSGFSEVVEFMAGMGDESFGGMRLKIKDYISEKVLQSDASAMTLRVFDFSNS
ncbi:hypothetical protein GCM10007933_02150 [Zoogloea oryzae]|uniref:Glycosyl transferase family 1 domain-containing protein n=1 Tax=Zoogloea oryzae TaxID=310767 RepID=A0ABQ6F5D4_9RHOO|nr:glycosyltransferase [Zoogloea oryzae]GLT20763.1 hypothetical protein GCM10007933_02150 [Zoogloea oryzae]